MKPVSFNNSSELAAYYDERYSAGYMDVWDAVKRQCVREIVAAIPKGQNFRVLDYGCGSGFFSRLLAELFPSIQIVGIDVSANAIAIAKERDANAAYFVIGDTRLEPLRHSFDLVFSHHVLEHVFDLSAVASDIASFVAPQGRTLHILPCANAGSFEYEICSLYPDGIDPSRGNRFFCEDPGHLRRLSSDDLTQLFVGVGFEAEKRYFMNQYWGALKWLSETPPAFLKQIFSYRRSDARKKGLLFYYYLLCTTLFLIRYPRRARIREKFKQLFRKSPNQSILSIAKGTVMFSAYPLAWIADQVMDHLSIREWNRHSQSPNGSEMAIIFRRT
jgi:SAM-dependent methyltransferase